MTNTKDIWTANPAGFDSTTIGRVTVIVWTGSQAADLDRGCEVCEAYIPTTDREYAPDGLMLVGRRQLETHNRDQARAMAVELAIAAMADRGVS